MSPVKRWKTRRGRSGGRRQVREKNTSLRSQSGLQPIVAGQRTTETAKEELEQLDSLAILLVESLKKS